jgi:hypothetical protein
VPQRCQALYKPFSSKGTATAKPPSIAAIGSLSGGYSKRGKRGQMRRGVEGKVECESSKWCVGFSPVTSVMVTGVVLFH